MVKIKDIHYIKTNTVKYFLEHVLGTYCCKTKQITTIKPNIIEKYLQRGKYYIRPENYKELEKEFPQLVFIYGVETTNELFDKITSQDDFGDRKNVGMLIFGTVYGAMQQEKVKSCFKLLKDYDQELYNSFGDDLLNALGLSTVSWWEKIFGM